MSQRDFLRAFDADAFAGFLEAGLGDAATYTAPGGAGVACTVLVDRSVREFGDDLAPVSTARTLLTFLRAEVEPVQAAVVVIGSESFKLEQLVNRDESISRWVVVNG